MDYFRKFIPNVVGTGIQSIIPGSILGSSGYNLGPKKLDFDLWDFFPEATGPKGDPVTILVFNGTLSQLELGRNYLRRLKTLRHPNILTYVTHEDTFGDDDGRRKGILRIIVERVDVPNIEQIRKNAHWAEWFIQGLQNAYNFLSTNGHLHGNLASSDCCVLMAQDGSPRLAGFEVCGPRVESAHLVELAERAWPGFRFSPDIDSFSRLLSRFSSHITPPKKNLVEDICNQLMTLPMRTLNERDVLFRRICQDLSLLPRPLIEYRIVPAVITYVENLSMDLAQLLLACRSEGALQILVECPDKAIRLMLLESVTSNSSSVVDIVKDEKKRDKLTSHLLGSIHDPQPALRDAALRASLTLMPNLSDKLTLECIKGYMRIISKEEQPTIRANALVCLNRCDRKFFSSSISLKSDLVEAISISLKDNHVQCRKLALIVTRTLADILEPNDIFVKILPNVSPLVMDRQDPDISLQACSLLKTLVNGDQKAPRLPSASINGSSDKSTKTSNTTVKERKEEMKALLTDDNRKIPRSFQIDERSNAICSSKNDSRVDMSNISVDESQPSTVTGTNRMKLGVARKLG